MVWSKEQCMTLALKFKLEKMLIYSIITLLGYNFSVVTKLFLEKLFLFRPIQMNNKDLYNSRNINVCMGLKIIGVWNSSKFSVLPLLASV